ncbi:TonB-dependent receptor [Bacteroides sp. UBA939]|uniref:TonB-dependent receptor n=1 Tax=Bacteroides sp. UBA939 TaxID=1946092 RepID=UPI0025C03FB1|nr:TonB-dependent receptor plug domain-containing protein [Bacteroides sp. UBA939]
MFKRLFFAILLSFMFLSASAQDFRGVIMNRKQQPLKGMKVWRKNTTESIKTNKMGVFAFPGLLSTDTLVISISRKEEAVIPVKNLKEVSIKIEKKFFVLYDGQKEQKKEYKRIIRAAINSNILTREQILKLSASSIYDVLKGNIPGVMVYNGDNGQQVSIRGGNSLELDVEPLFVVDGIQYESSSAVDASVSVNDIEKIEVQKEGAGYGMKGSNGVIIITTLKK